ncbi:protein Mis18-beta [Antennarius striatus]|uniref:protein Mis18-beta n=1 Tax=Antennarius striatus TaxID=241820 RepID=UPI0035B430EE
MEFDGSVLIRCTDATKMSKFVFGPHKGAKHKLRMTLHCQKCYVVLGDSFDICGEIKYMDSIMCLRVTDDVAVNDAMERRQKGEMSDCIYSLLNCRGCQSSVGRVIHSAPARLGAVRSIFLLSKADISCYILNSSSMVDASTLKFDVKSLKDSISEVKKQFEEHQDRMSRLKIRLANMNL